MWNLSEKLGKGFWVLAVTSSAALAYSALDPSPMDAVDVTPTSVLTQPIIKVENISLDYARAHIELMKQQDEEQTKSF